MKIIFLILLSFGYLFSEFDLVDGGPRAIGLGRAFSAISDDGNAIFYNPSGLGTLDDSEFNVGYRRLYFGLDDKSNLFSSFVYYVQPLWSEGSFGLCWHSFALTGWYSENVLFLSYGQNLSDWLGKKIYAGMTFKLLFKKYGRDGYTISDPLFRDCYSKYNFGFDFGILHKINYNYSVGLSLLNINTPNMNLKNAKMNIPITIILGFGYKNKLLSMGLDLLKKRKDLRLHFGIEKKILKPFEIRGGIGIGNRSYRNIGIGMSFRYESLKLNYTFSYPLSGIKDFYGTHNFSLNLPLKSTWRGKILKELIPRKIKKINSYIVKKGDTLPKISAMPEVYGDPLKWRKIYEANKEKISQTYELKPGTVLIIPRDD